LSDTCGSFETKLSDTVKVPGGSDSDALSCQNSWSPIAGGSVERPQPTLVRRMTQTIHANADGRTRVFWHGRGFRLQAEVSAFRRKSFAPY